MSQSVRYGHESLEWLRKKGIITEVIRLVKSGKEGEVYLTRRRKGDAEVLLAAKVHLPRLHRSFRREAEYRSGWHFFESSQAKAVGQMSRYGRSVVESRWVEEEYGALRRLREAGVQVPRPVAMKGNVILMEYLGTEEAAAPKLVEVEPGEEEARELFRQVIRGIRLMLGVGVVHGDLSPYNILVWGGKAWIIDLPQAVDYYRNENAMDLLYRDIRNVCGYFRNAGINADPAGLFEDMLHVKYIPNKTYQELLAIKEVVA